MTFEKKDTNLLLHDDLDQYSEPEDPTGNNSKEDGGHNQEASLLTATLNQDSRLITKRGENKLKTVKEEAKQIDSHHTSRTL